MKKLIWLLALSILISGCASIANQPMITKEILIKSLPSEATIYRYTSGRCKGDSCWEEIGKTPHTSEMFFRGKFEQNLKIVKDGYRPSYEGISANNPQVGVVLIKEVYYEKVIKKKCLEEYIPPPAKDIEKKRTYRYKFDKVWEAIVYAFASKNLSIKMLEKGSGIIIAEKVIDLASDIDYLVDVGHITVDMNSCKEVYSCPKRSYIRTDEHVRTKCKLKNSGPDLKKVDVSASVMMVYNVFASKGKDGVDVIVNADFRILTSNEKHSYRAVSTGALEKILLDSMDEFLTR